MSKYIHYDNIEEFKPVYINNEKTHLIVSNKGRVISTNYNHTGKERELKYFINKDGHYSICIKFKNKSYCKRVHRLVAEAFIPNPENKPEVHHIDGNRLNNDVNNLMWVTNNEHKKLTKELEQYHRGHYGEKNPVSKYSDKQIEKVCKLLEKNNNTMKEISEKTGVPYYVIQFLRYRDYSHKNIKEKYNISRYNTFNNKKYTEDQIHKVCELLVENDKSLKEISDITKVSYATVKMIRLRKRWINISNNYNF